MDAFELKLLAQQKKLKEINNKIKEDRKQEQKKQEERTKRFQSVFTEQGRMHSASKERSKKLYETSLREVK
jgi:hypothetical protein